MTSNVSHLQSLVAIYSWDYAVPPYGADEHGNIKSIFEIEHLKPSVLFLSIQCEYPYLICLVKLAESLSDRMPPLIGEVVSDVVYEGQLQSNPDHLVPSGQPCCWFVHVDGSMERQHEGTSWHVSVSLVLSSSIAHNFMCRTPLNEQQSLKLLRSSRQRARTTVSSPPMMPSEASWRMR